MNAEVMVEVVQNYLIRDHLDAVQRHFFLTDECFARAFFDQLRWVLSFQYHISHCFSVSSG